MIISSFLISNFILIPKNPKEKKVHSYWLNVHKNVLFVFKYSCNYARVEKIIVLSYVNVNDERYRL